MSQPDTSALTQVPWKNWKPQGTNDVSLFPPAYLSLLLAILCAGPGQRCWLRSTPSKSRRRRGWRLKRQQQQRRRRHREPQQRQRARKVRHLPSRPPQHERRYLAQAHFALLFVRMAKVAPPSP